MKVAALNSTVLRQPLRVGLDEFVDKAVDLVGIEFGGGVGVEEGRVVDVLSFAGEGGFDG